MWSFEKRSAECLIRLYHFAKQKKIRRIFVIVQYLIALVVITYLVRISEGIDFSKISLNYILLTMLSVILLRVNSICRFRIMLCQLNIPFREQWGEQAYALLLGIFTPGKVGEGVVIWTLGKGKEQKSLIASRFAFSKLLDGMVYIPFALLFALRYKLYLQWVLLLLVLFIIALFFYIKINRIFNIDNSKIRKRPIYALTILSLGLQIAGFYFILLDQDVTIPIFSAILIWSVAAVITLLSTLPGGIGAREASLAFLVSLLTGIELTTTASISLLYGFILYGTTFLFWLGSKIILLKYKKKEETGG